MTFGCLRYPEASTIGSQLLDEDSSYGWQILETKPFMNPHAEANGETGTHHTELTVERGKEGRGDT